MELKDKMPDMNRDYPESDISKDQKMTDKDQSKQSSENDDKVKGSGADIANMPEITPARPGVLGS